MGFFFFPQEKNLNPKSPGGQSRASLVPQPAPSSRAGNLPPGPPHRLDFVVFFPWEKRSEPAPRFSYFAAWRDLPRKETPGKVFFLFPRENGK